MASNTYDIRIVNNSSYTKTYGVFAEGAQVRGAGLQRTIKTLWYKFDPIYAGQEETFQFSSEFYAFVGRSTVPSRELEQPKRAGGGKRAANITLVSSQPVVLGDAYRRGSRLIVDQPPHVATESNIGATPTSTFTLGVTTSFPAPNKFVVGVARKHFQVDGGRVAPVAVVDLKPGCEIEFKPSQRVLVALVDASSKPGDVDPGELADAAVIEFSEYQREATVVEDNDGRFSTSYE